MSGLLFHGKVSRNRVENLLGGLQTAPNKLVHIDSPGGTFEFFSVLAPPLHRTGFRAIGGSVQSAAVILYLLGSVRYATADSTFFFHEVRAIVGSSLEITVCDIGEAVERAKEARERIEADSREYLEEWHRSMRNAQSWFLAFLQQHTGLRQSTFLDLMRREVTLSAREAIHYGLVHRIVSDDQIYNGNLP